LIRKLYVDYIKNSYNSIIKRHSHLGNANKTTARGNNKENLKSQINTVLARIYKNRYLYILSL
jgi:hypothetical protein